MMNKSLWMNRLKTILEAIVLENDKNRWFHNGRKLLHKGLEILCSMILNLIIAFLIAFCVAFTFFCYEHSLNPLAAIERISLNLRG